MSTGSSCSGAQAVSVSIKARSFWWFVSRGIPIVDSDPNNGMCRKIICFGSKRRLAKAAVPLMSSVGVRRAIGVLMVATVRVGSLKSGS